MAQIAGPKNDHATQYSPALTFVSYIAEKKKLQTIHNWITQMVFNGWHKKMVILTK